MSAKKEQTRKKRKIKRVASKIFGTSVRPRLSVFRSNKRIYAQVIDDVRGVTIAQAFDAKLAENITKIDKAAQVGQILGEKLVKKKIKTVVFDRRGYKYHGRVKALADGVRAKGVSF